jgi:hypothetical protein
MAASTFGREDAAEPPVWIVASDHWRAYLCAELIERGYDAVGFVTLQDVLCPGAEAPHRWRLRTDANTRKPRRASKRAVRARFRATRP